MQSILFATSNSNKLAEVRRLLSDLYLVRSLDDIGWTEEIPEPFDTIRENAMFKAQYFYEKTKIPCMAEDSGLEVHALGGKPGAYSARYAGEEKNDRKNMEKLLVELQNIEDTSARFISVFAYRSADREVAFEGEMQGKIIREPRGSNGFGYDPIFVASGEHRTNAELTMEEKNALSHRKKALTQWVDYLTFGANCGQSDI